LEDRYNDAVERRRLRIADERPFVDRVEVIMSAPRVITTDFWCNKCRRDCTGLGHRQVSLVQDNWPYAWFVGLCPEGHKLIRRITDKDSDPYYMLSRLVQRQRAEYADATLTPDDPRFKEIYPRQWEELMKPKDGKEKTEN